jgi:hypothetical protein
MRSRLTQPRGSPIGRRLRYAGEFWLTCRELQPSFAGSRPGLPRYQVIGEWRRKESAPPGSQKFNTFNTFNTFKLFEFFAAVIRYPQTKPRALSAKALAA